MGGFSGTSYNYIVYLAIALLLFVIVSTEKVFSQFLQPLYSLYI